MHANTSAFEALERDFQDVLEELMGDQSLEKFRLEYEKLHRALKKSHEQEKRLVKKCKELNTEILNNQAKIKTAIQLSKDDAKSIAHLQKEMEKTWGMLLQAREKEARDKERHNALREEIGNLSKLIEKSNGLSIQYENQIKDLKQQKDELQRQIDEQANRLQMMEKEVDEQITMQATMKNEKEASDKLSQELRDKITQKETENMRESRRREKTQKELQDARYKLDEYTKTELKMADEIAKQKNKIVEQDRNITDTKTAMEKYLKDYEMLFNRSAQNQKELDAQIAKNKEIFAEKMNVEKESKLKRLEMSRMNTEKAILERRLEKERRNALQYRQMAEDAKTPLLLAQTEIEKLKEELRGAHRKEQSLNRTVDKEVMDKENQMKKAAKAEMKVKDAQKDLKSHENEEDKLNHEISEYKKDIQDLRKAIFQLERDRERLSNEVATQRTNVVVAQEEIRLRDVQISELSKKAVAHESKLRHQQQQYDSVRADKNHVQKSLSEAKEHISQQAAKLAIIEESIKELNGKVR